MMDRLLDYAAWNNVLSLIQDVEENGLDLDGVGLWNKIRCDRNLGVMEKELDERTPLMVAAFYGSFDIIKHIISSGKSDVNKVCGSERVTALHCAVSGCSLQMVNVIKLLIDNSAWPDCVDANGKKPVDLLLEASQLVTEETVKEVQYLLSDYFMMYFYKTRQCVMSDQQHDPIDCPFLHPNENQRRRDLKLHKYRSVYCTKYSDGYCPDGIHCRLSHGDLERGLHPENYKTSLCDDGLNCTKKLCFFAHINEEIRPVGESLEKEEYERDKEEARRSAYLSDITKGYYATNFFRMYGYKVKPCLRADPHEHTDCAFVHMGEKSKRRDPKAYLYSPMYCPEFSKKKSCQKGENCERAHGLLESVFHPSTYKTQLCSYGENCSRKICFFAHRHEDLRRHNSCEGCSR